jgi:hypothetical protein
MAIAAGGGKVEGASTGRRGAGMTPILKSNARIKVRSR